MTQHFQMWLSIVALGLTAVNILWSWVMMARTAAASAMKAIETEVAALKVEHEARMAKVDAEAEALEREHDRRIQSLESEMKHLPTRQEIAELKVQLVEIVGQMRVVENEMAGAVRTIRRVEDHLTEARRA